jgi:hypothetical protein
MMSWHINCRKYIMTREWVALLLWSLLAMPAVADVFTGGLADPTRPAGAGGESSAPRSGVSEIRIAGSTRQAVIDGRAFRIGDRYGDGRIADILPYEVIVERAGRTARLRLIPKLEKEQRPRGQQP